MFQSQLEESKKRDLHKSALLQEKGITLIEIPYWWNRSYESLLATIHKQRPDLFTEVPQGTPIPLNPPSAKDKKINSIKTCVFLF